MPLYQIPLSSILNEILDKKISLDTLDTLDKILEERLPEYILIELRNYLKEDNNENSFYKSLYYKHFIFSNFFLGHISDKFNSINLGLTYTKDIETAAYLIKLGADNWDFGLIGATYYNNIAMIKFYIDQGAKDFNAAMIQAINTMNIELINYFIELGADNFDDGLFLASHTGDSNLILYFIKLGANNFKNSLGQILNNKHFDMIDLLIECIPKDNNYLTINKFKPNIMGNVLLYFIHNGNFETQSGINILELIPYASNGYILRQSAISLIYLCFYTMQYNYPTSKNTSKNTYKSILKYFNNMPSLNQIIKKKGKEIKQFNMTNSTTFDNIKILHPGFSPEYTGNIDKFYFKDMIDLNLLSGNQISIKCNKYIHKYNTIQQLWKEYQIIEAAIHTFKD